MIVFSKADLWEDEKACREVARPGRKRRLWRSSTTGGVLFYIMSDRWSLSNILDLSHLPQLFPRNECPGESVQRERGREMQREPGSSKSRSEWVEIYFSSAKNAFQPSVIEGLTLQFFPEWSGFQSLQ